MSVSVGKTYTTHVAGKTVKRVRCDHCSGEFAYRMEREAAGQELDLLWRDGAGARQKSEATARREVDAKLQKGDELVPCPSCGRFQRAMVKRRRMQAMMWGVVVSVVAAILGVVVIAGRVTSSSSLLTMQMVVAGVCGLGVVASLVLPWVWNPNRGAEGRRGIVDPRVVPPAEWDRIGEERAVVEESAEDASVPTGRS